MLRPKIGLDWDDVTAPFNDVAIQMANEKYKFDPPLTLNDIESWANTGRASVIKEFYGMEELYQRQIVPEENKKQIRKLMEIADVYFITAAYPQFMGIRAKQILEAFPDFNPNNIILGNAKNLVQFDIVLDDAIHNILESPASYPVLMRKPWNWKMTGLLSVNTMKEFVSLVEQIIFASHTKVTEIEAPAVIALVGPSGSGKTHLSNSLCVDPRFENPKTYCTKQSPKHRYLTEEQFEKTKFIEKTQYAGIKYGTKKDDIQKILDENKFAVMPLDMCGAIAMKQHFRTVIIYLNRDKEILIRDILKEQYSDDEKTLRILSIDAEKRNREICDFVINNDKEDAIEKVVKLTVGELQSDGGFFHVES